MVEEYRQKEQISKGPKFLLWNIGTFLEKMMLKLRPKRLLS